MSGKERPSLKMKSWLSEERDHLQYERSLAPAPVPLAPVPLAPVPLAPVPLASLSFLGPTYRHQEAS